MSEALNEKQLTKYINKVLGPSETDKKKKRKILWWLIGASCFVVVGGATATALIVKSCSPQEKYYNWDGTDWPGYESGSLTLVAIDQPMGSDLGTACITGNSEYTATNLIIPKYVSDISGKHYKIVEIGSGSFGGCYTLSGSLQLPDTLQTLAAGCFYDTEITGHLVIPNSVVSIGQLAFNSCSNLTALTLSNNVETIEAQAFENCISISGNLMLPISLINVNGARAFGNMQSINSISAYYTSNPNWTGTSIFEDLSSSGTVSNNGVGYTSAQFLTYLKTNKGLPAGWTAI